ncbi:MAG TPA: glycosyltransferase family 2 protein [Solirubrobacterales bacterium]|nr:glycosyltransferase family 2 protein [Solirubrobacterales bacterium]
MRAGVYIPNFNGGEHLVRALESLRAQTVEADVVVVDNGSSDGSDRVVAERFPEVVLLRMQENLGFGTALNRAVAAHPTDAIVLLNNDAAAEPRFVEALVDGLGTGVDSVAGVMLQERDPGLIDSAGVVADRTLMGFDYLHGETVPAAASAPAPLGPTGGAALYRREAFEAVGGFDQRIFLYYEDLDLALRLAARGGACRLAPEARALHAYSAGLGPASAAKYARTGWSRGYMLRRYGVMSDPRLALRVLASEGAVGGGQLLRDHTAAGIKGRLRGFHAGAGLERRDVAGAPLLDITTSEAIARRRRRRA